MDLAIQLLSKLLERQQIRVTFPDLTLTAQEMVEASSYQALCQIREILRDDSLSDPECFEKIERIVCLFEQIGSNCGSRHDFG
ncbi:hypothetical protein [Flavonifractor sp. AGMB03687]|uniref:hypothetical protein n=1 Tax=Flavonifractor sp. AGMB03687 TaxID=2785133 RepID=UPI001ADF4F01|nr:hypothetical protein [Flavonifractor sp. AGMB03687]